MRRTGHHARDPRCARRRRRALAALLAATLGLAAAGCERPPPAAAGPLPACDALHWNGEARRRPVVLLLADTTRRDRVGAYGGPARTPVFDRFAGEHLLFTSGVSQAPWTKPAVATLFTGLHPSQHGVLSHPNPMFGEREGEATASDLLPEGFDTLAETLARAGYDTAAFVSNPWLDRRMGFAQGFGHYDDSFAGNDTPGQVVVRAGLRWLGDRADEEAPYFLYLHTMDAHGPYPALRPEDVEARRDVIAADPRRIPPRVRFAIREMARYEDGSRVVEPGLPPNLALLELLYDRGVEDFDRTLGVLLEGLRARPEWEEMAVLVVSDHGEALYTRGWGSHGHGLFDDEIAVPFAARLPGVEADGPVTCPVGLVDVMATLCTYLGVSCPEQAGGQSLLAPEAWTPRYLITEGVIAKPEHRAVRNDRFALLYEPEGRRVQTADGARPWSLYDLERDPAEQRNLLAADPPAPEHERIFGVLREALETGVPEVDRPRASAPLDEDLRRRLEALGYGE